MDLTPGQERDVLAHAGAAPIAYNWALARVKAVMDQRAAERSYGVPEDQLTPALSWSLPALRRAWNAAKDEVAPWWRECSKEVFNTGLAGGVLLVVAVVGLAWCALRLLPAGFVWVDRGLPTVVLLRGLASAAFAGSEAFIPLLLSRERGLSPALAGLALAVSAMSWSAGSWLQGWLKPPASRGTPPRVGMLLIATGIAVTALLVLHSVPVAVGVLGWAAAGFGMGPTYPTLSTLTLELSAPAEQGRNSSALQLADSLFAAAVLAVGGALFAADVAPGPATYLANLSVTGGLAVLGVLLAGRVVESTGG